MIMCFNRDLNGNCLAYNSADCKEGCSARIKTIEDKITLLRSLMARAQSKKDQRRLEEELTTAKEYKRIKDARRYESWMSCYVADLNRGEGGGASESDSNRKTSMKQLMKDNRPVDVKPTKAQTAEYKEALEKWEEENGKLEKMGRTGMSHSKVDSYTGEGLE